MKSLLIALLLTAPLAAEGLSPSAGAGAAAALSPAATVAPSPVASPVATPPPPFDPATAAHGGFYVPYWGAALHLAGAMPLGDMGTYNGMGFGVQVDLLYHPADSVTVDVFALTDSLPAITPSPDANTQYTGSTIPFSLLGAGVKGGYVFYRADQMTLGITGGLGLGSVKRTHRTSTIGFGGTVIWDASASPSLTGLLMTASVQVTYQVAPHLNLLLDLGYAAVNLAGGTGDSPQLGLPSVGAQYDFD